MRKIKLSIFIILIMMLALPTMVQAGFQSVPNKYLYNKMADEFFEGCRNMEADGGVLGLSENIQTTTYLGTTNNGIDAHMALNTEWGTIALLTDSAYGMGKDISGRNNSKTSTGNSTGICGLTNGNYEYVASTYSGTNSTYNTKIRNANARYFTNYSSNTSKAGDALNCTNWLNASSSRWINANNPAFRRGYDGLFGFGSDIGAGQMYSGSGSRAVVVCGAGL